MRFAPTITVVLLTVLVTEQSYGQTSSLPNCIASAQCSGAPQGTWCAGAGGLQGACECPNDPTPSGVCGSDVQCCGGPDDCPLGDNCTLAGFPCSNGICDAQGFCVATNGTGCSSYDSGSAGSGTGGTTSGMGTPSPSKTQAPEMSNGLALVFLVISFVIAFLIRRRMLAIR